MERRCRIVEIHGAEIGRQPLQGVEAFPTRGYVK